ncbi:hypothetical protein [Persephonella sp. KM09-Lau-8]|uniref:hypothetical protein n=1 Tax=Persephonella sp. KM09-Lau-8 TaxID=1158345 RepID=UPI000494F1A0|nr:hypothetical protein [Persephonella sp. KM09-Lau-8]
MRKIISLFLFFMLFNFSIGEPSHKDKCSILNILGVLHLYCGQIGEVIKDRKEGYENCVFAPDVAAEYTKEKLGNKKAYNEIIDTLFKNEKMRLSCVRSCRYGYELQMEEIKKEIREALSQENCKINKIFR